MRTPDITDVSHMPRRLSLLVITLACLGATFAPAFAEDARLSSPLDCADLLPGGLNGCVLRLSAGESAPSIEATKADGSNFSTAWKLIGPTEVANLPKVDLSGTLVLVDVTQGKNGGHALRLRDEKAAIKAVLQAMPPGELIALHSFGATRTELVPFTRDRQALLSAVDGLKLTETNTLLQRNLIDAIRIVEAQPTLAIGRVLVISDGLDEDIAPPSEAIRLAQQTGVSISAMGSFWQKVGDPDIGRGRGYLEALAAGTAGEFGAVEYRKTVEAQSAIFDLSQRLWQARQSSRLVVLNDGTKPERAKIVVKVDRPVAPGYGQREVIEYKADYIPLGPDGKPLPPPPKPAPVVTKPAAPPLLPVIPPKPPESPVKVYLDKGMKLARDYWYVLAAVAALAALGGLGALIVKRRKSEDEDFDFGEEGPLPDVSAPTLPESSAFVPVEKTLATLVAKNSGRVMSVKSERVSIGRGSKNDLILAHNSISRAHAILQVEPNGFMSVTDLQSLNGTFVNGTRVGETQQVKFGDAIKLGDVTLILQHP